MKKLIVLILMITTLSFGQQKDSLDFYRNYYHKQHTLSTQTFIKAYKYDRLLKYYTICKKKPTQWKYYKGWSTRVFEQK